MDRLLAEVKALFAGVAEAAAFMDAWPAGGQRREVGEGVLPVCEELGRLKPAAGAAPVWEALRAARGLSWRQTYGAAEMGEAFLRGYGWAEFIGLRGPVPSETIACGVLLLGPGVTYPAHAHAAEEVYLPIAGAAEWMRAEEGFAARELGRAIHHPSWVPHGMRTGAEGVAALYLWRGGDLAAKSVFVRDEARPRRFGPGSNRPGGAI